MTGTDSLSPLERDLYECMLSREGSVLAQRAVPEKLKYRRLVRFEEVAGDD